MQEGWKPIRLGEKLLVKFTWHGDGDVRPFLEATPGLQLMTLEGRRRTVACTSCRRQLRLIDQYIHTTCNAGGAAFGSGEHATTTMCCEWLEKRLSEQRQTGDGAPLRVIDYGSGSGILGASDD